MLKDRKFILLGTVSSLMVILIVILFIYPGYLKPKEVTEPIKESIGPIILKEGEKQIVLEKDIKASFLSKSLQPSFIVKGGKKISDLKIYFDNSEEDLLTGKFSDAIIKKYDQGFEISFPYALKPESHRIVIKYLKQNEEVVEEYPFLLILFDDFSVSLHESSLWGLTASASQHNNWEIKEGQLIANSLPEEAEPGAISSLFFIRRFRGNFFIQFDLIAKSDNLSFLIYLLERKLNFVFGNGSNRDIVLLQKDIRGDFIFEISKTYHIRLVRNKNVYKIFITERDTFSDKDLLFVYEDKEQIRVPFDSFGFTIWKVSGGVEIDNFYTANEDISNVLK